MSSALMQAVFDRDLPAPEKHVLTVMAWFGSDDGTSIFPSIQTLCRRTGYKRSNVQKIIDKLKKRGILILEMRMPQRRGFVPVYRMDLTDVPLLPPESVHPRTPFGGERVYSSTPYDGVTKVLPTESIHSAKESVHSAAKGCTPVAERVYSSGQEQYLAVKEQERTVTPKFSISDSQKQTQEQKQNLPYKGKPEETFSARDVIASLPGVVGSQTRKISPFVDDEELDKRKAQARALAERAEQRAREIAQEINAS